MSERYRSLQDMLRLPVGAGEALVYTPLGRRAEVIGQKDLALLGQCLRFASLHEHASRLQGPMVSATASLGNAVAQLERLAKRGLLVSERDLHEKIRAVRADEAAPPPIRHIGIPTGGRHDLAVAAIESVNASLPADRDVELVVAHDAADEAESESLLAAVRALDMRDHITLRYIGPGERQAYAEALVEETPDVDPALVRRAFVRCHPTIWAVGVLRNALMMDGIGGMALQIDDDIRCEIGAPPICEPGMAFTSAGSVMELWFPAAGLEAESLVELEPGDVPAVHERLLGRSLGACLSGHEDLDLCDATGAFLRRIISGAGRVRCTQMGIVGDSATGSLAHYLMLHGKSRERLVISERIYDHAFASRQGARAPRRDSISDGTFCMSYALGLDLRELLPPFIAEGRNADGVWGNEIRHCFRDSYFGYLPEVVAHRAPSRSSSMEELLSGLDQVDVNDLFCRVVAASGLRARIDEPRHTMEVLGAHLERLGDLPLADLEEMLRTLVLRTRSRDLAMLRSTLSRHHRRPAYWSRDVGRLVEHLSEVILEPTHTFPRDLMKAYGEEAGRQRMGTHLKDHGRLLQIWSEIDAAARRLRERGVRPSRLWA